MEEPDVVDDCEYGKQLDEVKQEEQEVSDCDGRQQGEQLGEVGHESVGASQLADGSQPVTGDRRGRLGRTGTGIRPAGGTSPATVHQSWREGS